MKPLQRVERANAVAYERFAQGFLHWQTVTWSRAENIIVSSDGVVEFRVDYADAGATSPIFRPSKSAPPSQGSQGRPP